MDHHYKRFHIHPETMPDYAIAPPGVKVRITQANTTAAQPITRSPADKLRQAPATPLMLTPTAAWRKLCAKTGGSVTIQTFYRWIGNGSVYSVRMGKRIFVPIDNVEKLIETCLAGEDLKSSPG